MNTKWCICSYSTCIYCLIEKIKKIWYKQSWRDGVRDLIPEIPCELYSLQAIEYNEKPA